MRRLLAAVLLVVLVVPAAASAGTREEPEATDDCGTDEATDVEDATTPDAPWADLCAAWVSATVTNNALDSVTVTAQVAGYVAERTHTTSWAVQLQEGDCEHVFSVADDTITDEQLRVRQRTSCGYTPGVCPEPFPTVMDILREHGVASECVAGGSYDSVDAVDVAPSAVTFGTDTISLTLSRAQLNATARERLVPGTTIESVNATATLGTIVYAGSTSNQTVVDVDMATPTGRTYTIGG